MRLRRSVKAVLFLSVVATGGLTAACDYHQPKKTTGRIVYFKDQRTGLCFAAQGIDNNGVDTQTQTYVPCTPEVERLLSTK